MFSKFIASKILISKQFLDFCCKVTLKRTPVFIMWFIKSSIVFASIFSSNDSTILAISIVHVSHRSNPEMSALFNKCVAPLAPFFFHCFARALDLKPSLKIYLISLRVIKSNRCAVARRE